MIQISETSLYTMTNKVSLMNARRKKKRFFLFKRLEPWTFGELALDLGRPLVRFIHSQPAAAEHPEPSLKRASHMDKEASSVAVFSPITSWSLVPKTTTLPSRYTVDIPTFLYTCELNFFLCLILTFSLNKRLCQWTSYEWFTSLMRIKLADVSWEEIERHNTDSYTLIHADTFWNTDHTSCL